MKIYYVFLFLICVACNQNSYVDPGTGQNIVIQDVEEDTTSKLEGHDQDNDDVRDDIQKWIDQNIHDYNINMAMKQYVKYKTLGMKVSSDKNESRKYQNLALDALACLDSLGYDHIHVKNLTKNLKEVLLNTEERLRANEKSEGHLGGSERIQGSDEYYLSKCEFKYEKRK